MAVSRKARIAAVIAALAVAPTVLLPTSAQAAPAPVPVPTPTAPVHAPAPHAGVPAPATANTPPAPGTAAAPDQVTTSSDAQVKVRVKKVVTFKQAKGQDDAADRVRAELVKATWVFNGNGTFAFRAKDPVEGLYPLHGKWELKDTTVLFTATGTKGKGDDAHKARVIGDIDLSGAEAIMRFGWASGGSSFKPEEQPFGNSADTLYAVVMQVKPVD